MRTTTFINMWRSLVWGGAALVAAGLAAWPVWSQVPAPPAVPKVTDAPKAPEAPKVPEAPSTPDAPKVPDAPKTPDAPKAPKTPDANPDLPVPPKAETKPETKPEAKPGEAPRNPNAPEAPRNPNAPDAPRNPAAPGPNNPMPRDPNERRDDRRDDRRDAANDRRDAADDRRDDRRDAADDRRDARVDGRANVRGEFRAADVRAADIGIWFNRNTTNGLVINSVNTTGAISKLGFRDGDRIISVNGQKVLREADFVSYLFADNIRRQRVQVVVFRGGQEQVVWVEPYLLVDDYTTTYSNVDPVEEFGIIVDDRHTDQIVVWRVVPRSPAYYAGIRAGDVLVTLHGQKLTNHRQLVTVVQGLETGVIPVQVLRNRQNRTLEVDYTVRAGAGARRTSLRPDIDARDNKNDVERANPRREDRIEDRQDRREDAREGRIPDNDRTPDAPALERNAPSQPAAQPATQPQPRRRVFSRGR